MRSLLSIAAATSLILALPSAVDAGAGSVILRWTATGNDSLVGTATAYDLRYSLSPITAANWGSTIGVAGVPPPAPSGTHESFMVTGLPAGAAYYFAIKARDEAGNWSLISNVIQKTVNTTLDADPPSAALSFSTPRPNPARAGTQFTVDLPASTKAQIEAFDLSGRRVRTLAEQEMPAGVHPVRWDLYDEHGSRLAPGVYKVRARFGGATLVRTVVVVR